MSQFEDMKKLVERFQASTLFPSPEDIEADEVLHEYEDGGKIYIKQPWTNGRGNLVIPGSHSCDRYVFDTRYCTSELGWEQYDTEQDAWYFGVWVHADERLTFTYCEGDWSLVQCPTEESFRAELADMARVYGSPPPALVALGLDGSVTNIYSEKNAFGREIPEDGVVAATTSDAFKAALGGD